MDERPLPTPRPDHLDHRVPKRHPAAVVRPLPPRTIRIGDAERTAACDELCQHFAAGRLGADELDDRLDVTVAARTQHDLDAVFHDLGPLPAPVAAAQPADVSPSTRPASVVWAVVLLVGCLLTAGGMLVLLGLVSFGLFLAACVGGTAAALGGFCLGHVARWELDQASRRRPAAVGANPQARR